MDDNEYLIFKPMYTNYTSVTFLNQHFLNLRNLVKVFFRKRFFNFLNVITLNV